MNRYGWAAAAAAAMMALGQAAEATSYVEDFEAPFPAWESGWLGQHSNLQNYYGVGGDRGNNPDGLWLSDGGANGTDTVITFDSAFAATISSFDLDFTTFSAGITLTIWDKDGATLLTATPAATRGAYTDPGSYLHFGVTSANGVGGFSMFGGAVEGNTSIDNVTVAAGASGVPEPTVWALMLTGFGLAGVSLRRGRVAFAA